MLVELQTGAPLFPGSSDVDQLWRSLCCLASPSFGYASAVAQCPNFAVRLSPIPGCSFSALLGCLVGFWIFFVFSVLLELSGMWSGKSTNCEWIGGCLESRAWQLCGAACCHAHTGLGPRNLS